MACANFKPDILISQLFQVDMAYRLGAETETPWCFIDSTYYFGRQSTRSTVATFPHPLWSGCLLQRDGVSCLRQGRGREVSDSARFAQRDRIGWEDGQFG